MFPGESIQFNLSNFNIIFGINQLYTYEIRIHYKGFKVILCNEGGQGVHLYGQTKEKNLFLKFLLC